MNSGVDMVSTWITKHQGHTEDPLSRKSMGM
jgi:hypothetical protein